MKMLRTEHIFYRYNKLIVAIILPVIVMAFGACNNRAIMFKVPNGYVFDEMTDADRNREYKIGINDNLSIFMLPNSGNLLFENIGESFSGTGQLSMMMSRGNRSNYNAVVEFDGTIKLPTLGRLYVDNLTVRELELLLEENFRKYFNDPFVNVTANNRRVVIFPGTGGTATILNLVNPNTSLLEGLASAGGIPPNGKSDKVIVIRDHGLASQKIFKIDLSKIDNLGKADFMLQANDIIYVDTRNELVLNFLTRASPYLLVINTIFFTVFFFRNSL
jgi:polysaccharide export outer membrane protein